MGILILQKTVHLKFLKILLHKILGTQNLSSPTLTSK